MSKKISFIRKKPMEGIGGRVMQGTLTAVAATGGMYAMNKLIKPESKFKKYSGLIGIGLHLGAECFVEEPYTLAIARGLGAAGAIHTTGHLILPNSKADFGLAGVGSTEQPGAGKQTVTEVDGTPEWMKIAAQAEAERVEREQVQGLYEEEPQEPVQGIGAFEQSAINMMLAA